MRDFLIYAVMVIMGGYLLYILDKMSRECK